MNSAAQFAIISGISLAAAGATWFLKGAPVSPALVVVKCDPAKIGPDEICLADVGEDVLWVDARPRSEWQENGLDGSILWNLDPKENQQEMEAGAAMSIASGQPSAVIVYCGSEACGTSKQIAERVNALDLGVPVKTLFGGWDALRAIKDSNPAK